MELTTLRRELHQIVLDARAIEAFVLTPGFARAYNSMTPEEKATTAKLAREGHRQSLTASVKRRQTKNIYDMSIRELRGEARRLSVSNYSRLLKDELITYIQLKRKETTNA
jgi:hypothetical protein